MEFKILLADSDDNYLSLLGRALLGADYLLYPAESKEIALQQIAEHDIDAAIVDVDLPGGVDELLEACLDKSKTIVAVGALPLKETEHLVEILYYGVPYVEKFSDEGSPEPGKIIARMNTLPKTLLMFSNNKEYGLGVLAGLSTRGYEVFVADRAEDLLLTFLVSEPEAILVYFPKDEDLQEIARIRKIDGKIPIAIVTNCQQTDLGGQTNHEATRVITQDRLVDYLEEPWLSSRKV